MIKKHKWVFLIVGAVVLMGLINAVSYYTSWNANRSKTDPAYLPFWEALIAGLTHPWPGGLGKKA